MDKQITLFTPELPLPALRTIKRALVLLEQHLREPGVAFTSTQATRDWLRLKMGTLEREEFVVLYLNNQNQLLAQTRISCLPMKRYSLALSVTLKSIPARW